LDLDQTRHDRRPRGIHSDQDRAGFEIAGEHVLIWVLAGLDLGVGWRPHAAAHQGRRVENQHSRPMGRSDSREHYRRIRVEVVDCQVRLAARRAGANGFQPRFGRVASAQDRAAQVAAGISQAHALADTNKKLGNLVVAEDEVGAGPDAFVALVGVIAVRAAIEPIGMVFRWLADRYIEREHVAARLRRVAEAAIARPAIRL
jgi:hypothetical protein